MRGNDEMHFTRTARDIDILVVNHMLGSDRLDVTVGVSFHVSLWGRACSTDGEYKMSHTTSQALVLIYVNSTMTI